MDKLSALRAAIDEILDDDHVILLGDGSYEVHRRDGGETLRVRRTDQINDQGDWTVFFESGHPMPYAPRNDRPNEIVAWALL